MKIKQLAPYLLSVLAFVAISFIYFAPDIMEGKVLFQGDTQQGLAVGHEMKNFYEETGEQTRWTNSLFGGMPTYQISPTYSNSKVVQFLMRVYSLFLPSPVSLIFVMLLGFFILLVTLRLKWYIAFMGAIAYAFSSYFFIIIEAGHIWKFLALAYIPLTIAGILLTYRGRYLLGTFVAALGLMFQLAANHVQMTYYFMFVILFVVVAIFIDDLRSKKLVKFFKASAFLVVAALIGAATALPNLYNTYHYTQETMRGKNELVVAEQVADSHEVRAKSGLSEEYITQWSYGLGETFSFLVPNIKGGSTGALGNNKEAMKEAKPVYREFIASQNQYWGDQPFTSGPVYVGAFVLFLFVLGCFIVKTPLKWALLGVTALTVILSWGHNFMPLSSFFIDYFPLYNKFRTVSSILVVAEFCIPLLAMLALAEIIKNPAEVLKKRKAIYISLALTAGVALVFAIFPKFFFNFLSSEESAAYLPQVAQQRELGEALTNLQSIRSSILSSDAWRSFAIIIAGVLFLGLFLYKKINIKILVTALTIVILGDMYMVNKRYLNSDSFVPKRALANPFPMSDADRLILQDPDPNYRVLNTTVDPFNDSRTSYYHKSVGGYHAAKLSRYQDVIEQYLSKFNMNILDMLNTKYFIMGTKEGGVQVQQNPNAMGNAWFVSQVKWVATPREEIDALGNIPLRDEAVINQKWQSKIPAKLTPAVMGDTLRLLSYKPNELVYSAQTAQGALAVFSEIFYADGWKATIDGEEVPIVQADYILRGLYIPSGDHKVVFTFKPHAVDVTETIAMVAIFLILITAVILLWLQFKKEKSNG